MPRTIRGLRNDLHLSQEEMAKKLGVSTKTYSRYENLETKIPYEIVIAICDMAKIVDPREVKFY